jgi:hypothetical protein
MMELYPIAIIHPQYVRSKRKSKPTTHFLFCEKGARGPGKKGLLKGKTLGLGEVALLPDINNK